MKLLRNSIVLLCLLTCVGSLSAQGYKALMVEAQKRTNDTNTASAKEKEVFELYRLAFSAYPDSITPDDRYSFTRLATTVGEYDHAFKHLTLLIHEKDNYGLPFWDVVTDNSSKEIYAPLQSDPRWGKLVQEAEKVRTVFYTRLNETEKEFFAVADELSMSSDGKTLYRQLRNHHVYLPKKQQNYSIRFALNDSIRTSYFVHLPKEYNPQKAYPVLFFLHGAVRYNSLLEYQTPEINLYDWNRFYTKYADKHQVILVFPRGNRQYNWMLSDDGFFMVPDIVRQLKKALNIDDNKIFVSGHSNGATGAFSYLMKQPTLFAGFYGFNTHPKVYTGGTFIENALNRSFVNFSTDMDYYYPPQANDTLNVLMKAMGAEYSDHRFNGFPHWFPKFDESEPAYVALFADLAKRTRQPFPAKLTWECDDERYGVIDWLSDIRLDTLATRADWHKNTNFRIRKWLEYDKTEEDKLISKDTDIPAFAFPRRSGKITATYQDNVFRLYTSCVKAFRINISPEMIDMDKKVKVYVNDKLAFHDKVKYDVPYMLKQFRKEYDKQQLWVNQILITF